MMYTLEHKDFPSPDTQINDKLRGYPAIYPPTGNSTDERAIDEMLNYVNSDLIKREKAILYPNIQVLLDIDLSSINPYFRIKNEASSIQENVEKTVSLQLSEEVIVMEMVDHDIITGLPPKRRYKVELKVMNIRRGKPKIVDPEEF
uniref:Uncharacterized protein n=2 Tax=Candidatus Methanophagaceae archaeon ANME-1 ERB6 TaxID=2759912 RepID=A0A7G9YUV6_9EURY|nr:hypothetical protein PFGANNDM_00025 [Methanosarcinales archaeon ANME-1 ERB6]